MLSLRAVENVSQSVEKTQFTCGNSVECVGKIWLKDKNCKKLESQRLLNLSESAAFDKTQSASRECS
jgi:hypothetical protein